MSQRTCDVDGCDRKHVARGLCGSHYNQEHATRRFRDVQCPTCGTVTSKRDDGASTRRFCSLICRDVWRCDQPDDPMHKLGKSVVARGPRKPKRSALPDTHPVMVLIHQAEQARRDAKSRARSRAARSPVRAAFEDQDWPALIAAIEALVAKVDGCWIWSRQAKDGYGKIQFGTKPYSVHRLVVMARLNGQLDPALPVHHKCAVTLCVNPDHLQVVTHRENVAEMLERRYYIQRIALLEESLRAVDPEHAALHPWRSKPAA